MERVTVHPDRTLADDLASDESSAIPGLDLVQFNRESAWSRMIATAILMSVCVFIEAFLKDGGTTVGVTLRRLWVPCALSCLVSLAVLRTPFNRRYPWVAFYLQMVADLSVLTMGIRIATTGAAAVAARAMYALIIVPPNLISARAGVLATIGAVVCHLILVGLDSGWHSGAFLNGPAIAPIVVFFLVANMSFGYGGHFSRARGELLALAQRLESSRARSAGMVNLAKTLNSSTEARDLFERVNENVQSALGASWCATFRVDAASGRVEVAAASDLPYGQGVDLRPIQARVWPILNRLAVERTLWLEPEDGACDELPIGGLDGFSKLVVTALHREDKMLGFLALGFEEWDEENDHLPDRGHVAAVAEHVTIALHNALLIEEARQAAALKSEFLSTVSHELRTPLNVILGYAEMLREGEMGMLSREQLDLFDRIDTNARELNELVETVLSAGKIESGRDMVHVETVSIQALLASIESAVSNLPRNEAVALRVEATPQAEGEIETDAAKVGLVVRNLVGNAFKFTTEGEVNVTLAARGETLRIRVGDTGIGIDAEHLPSIFEMFQQGESEAAAPRARGVGLGLYIVQKTVRRLGGSVRVESEAGAGTVFEVDLPGLMPSRAVAVGAE